MRNFYPETPQGKLGEIKTGYPPAKITEVSTTRENASASSVTALSHDTTEIEIIAIGQPVVGRWAANQAASVVTIAGSANIDFFVETGTGRRFAVPIQTSTPTSGSIMGVNRKLGLYQNIATRTTAGNGSVMLIEN